MISYSEEQLKEILQENINLHKELQELKEREKEALWKAEIAEKRISRMADNLLESYVSKDKEDPAIAVVTVKVPLFISPEDLPEMLTKLIALEYEKKRLLKGPFNK